MARKKETNYYNDRKFPEPASDEERASQLLALAMDLVEHRLREGTATSAEITSIMRYGSEEARLKRDDIATHVDLMKSKKVAIDSQTEVADMIKNGFSAYGTYIPGGSNEDFFGA